MKDPNYSSRLIIAEREHTRERDYWLGKMSGELTKTTFFPDHVKSSALRTMNTLAFSFPQQMEQDLHRLSKGSGVKLHMVLLVGLTALLYKYTANTDIILGAPIYKQEVAGEFVNTFLPIRTQIQEQMSFKELLFQVRQTMAEAVKNQAYPMEILLERLGMELKSDGDFPLFDVAVLLEGIHQRKYLEGIRCNFIFTFSLPPGDGKGKPLTLTVEYNSERYEASSLERIVTHFRVLLGAMTGTPDRPIRDLAILSESERRRLLIEFNDSRGEVPLDRTIHEIFQDRAGRCPDAAAVMYGDQWLTYRELNRRSSMLAQELRRWGVAPDTIVGLMEERSLEMIIGIMAILLAGGAYLAIDAKTPGKRIISMLEDSGAAVLLSNSTLIKNNSYTVLQGLSSGRAELHRTAPRPPIADLDSLPIPDRSLLDYETYNKFIGISIIKNCISLQATRGCPYKCAYCHRIWPKIHVFRSAEHIFEEVRLYHQLGIRRFVILDDVFNLNIKNSSRFFQLVLKHGLQVEFYFANGLRGDILTKDFIDLMVEAGTVNIGLALETASPRLQKLIGKNLQLDKFRDNTAYLCEKYPDVIVDLNTMHGFPTETEQEAMMTLDFIKSMHWLHFVYIHVVKIYHNTAMEELALANGVSAEAIERSVGLAYHEIPETLPFDKSFSFKYQTDFFNNYFMSRERLLHVLPVQLAQLHKDELVQKYDSYLPIDITSLDQLLEFFNIHKEEVRPTAGFADDAAPSPGLNLRLKQAFPRPEPDRDAFRVLLLDLSQYFSKDAQTMYNVVEAPMGLMCLLTYLNRQLGPRVHGKIAKARIDFDSFAELHSLLEDFRPQVIGIRTLTYYKDFFHDAVSRIRQWGINVPIITGGPYASSDYTTVLQDSSVDLAVIGEGELTFCELIEKIMENQGQLPPEDVLKEIKGLVFPKKQRNRAQRFARRIVLLDTLEEIAVSEDTAPLQNINRPVDLAYNIYTSGSTGRPKAVLLEHRHLVNLMWYHLHHSGLNLERVLQFATINFDVSIQEIFPPLLAGGTLFLIHRDMMTDIPVLFGFVEKNDIKTLFLPASFLKFVLNEKDYVAMLPGSVAHIVPAGEQLIVTGAFRKYLQENRIFLHNHYGPSETHLCTVLTMDPRVEIPELPSIGKPTLNATIYIVNKHMDLQPIGVPGELYIGGLQVGRGLLNRVNMTANKFLPDPFSPFGAKGRRMYHSGDLARWLEDGNIQFLGRIDHQVKIRGFRIELGEIENRLLELEKIKEAVVVDRVDKKDQKYLCAYIVTHEAVEPAAIRKQLAIHLPEYMIPSYFMRLEQIPLTFNRKVNRKALPDPESSQKGQQHVSPRDELETRLRDTWAEVLEIDPESIGIDDNFFEIGGHSLNATILTGKIHKRLHVKIKLSEIFVSPTIRELAAHIKELEKAPFITIEPAPKKKYYALSSAQKRLYIHQQIELDNVDYNLFTVMVLEGLPDRERFESSFQQLINRHESLRTSFVMVEDEPMQTIAEEVEFNIEYYEVDETSPGTAEITRSFIRPFDLSQAPLMRVGLVKENPERHILAVDMHHIITDGISMGILSREFMKLYAGEQLPGLSLHYKDFSHWQNRLFESGEIKHQERYWLERFSSGPPLLNLPTDYPRPEVRNFEGGDIYFEINSQLSSRIDRQLLQSGVTSHIFLLAVYTILISKYSGQEDIVVGTGIAGRRHADLENIIGLFINMLPMRNQPDSHKNFDRFLAEVKDNALDAYANQDYQFEELVQKLGLQGNPSRNPFFDTVFQTQNINMPGLNIQDLTIKPYEVNLKISHFDLVVSVFEYSASRLIRIMYATALFKESTLHEMGRHFIRILEQVLENPRIKLEDINVPIKFSAARPKISKNKAEFRF